MNEQVGSCWERIFLGVLIFVFLVLAVALLSVMCCDSAEKFIVQLLGVEDPKKYEALKFLGIGLGGVLLALQALMAYKRAKALEDTADAQAEAAKAQAKAAKAQAKATREQAKANENTEQGQRQERLKNAIEHLGHKSDSVRLGGAYELFHLARDTEEEELRQTVLDILCAHIRRMTGEPEYRDRKEHQSKPSEEIQSLLTLLFVQKHEVFTGLDINLRGSWLNGSNLSRARLEKADLLGAHLSGAFLVRAQLHGAILGGAQLHGAQLEGARLHGAMLGGAQLHGANLILAQLHGVHLGEAQLHGTFLIGAQLHGAYLMNARLHGADLMSAQLHGACLIRAQLHGATLRGAQLHGAQLGGAQLHGAASISARDLCEPFEASINRWIGKQSDLSGAISAGGLTREVVASIGEGLPDEEAKKLRATLEVHIGKPESHGLPKNSDAIIGAYTKEEADRWIAEYKTAVSGRRLMPPLGGLHERATSTRPA